MLLQFIFQVISVLAKEKEDKMLSYPPILSYPTIFSRFCPAICSCMIQILSFIGASMGFIELIPAICHASEIKRDITTIVIALAFASFPFLFGFLLLLIFGTTMASYQYSSPEIAFYVSGLGLMGGFGLGLTGYALCVTNKSLIIAKMKQKDFNLQFFLCNIFVELVGILSFISIIVPLIRMPGPKEFSVYLDSDHEKASVAIKKVKKE